ncbi:MAG: hypothetical protein LAO04_12145 [Acidobacteriia bacterium]|nr:hypothetical protein [Terriglobia bacterium]
MIFLRSILAGLLLLVGAAILLLLGTIIISAIAFPPERGTAIGFDPVSMVKYSSLIQVLVVLFFFLGFSWEYRRVSARRTR